MEKEIKHRHGGYRQGAGRKKKQEGSSKVVRIPTVG